MKTVAIIVAWFVFLTVHKSEVISDSIPQNDHEVNYDMLLNVARNGLHQTTSKKNIIVVGAGIAGLSAAYTLQQAGYQVTILEASDRVGGRILTYKDKAGWQVELGGMRIPETHQLLLYYIKDLFQLQLKEFINSDPETYYYFNGIRKKYKDYLKDPDCFGFDTLPEEKGKTAEELVEMVFKPYIEELRLKGWRYFTDTYDHMSLYELFVQKTNLSEPAVDMIGKLLNMDSQWHSSFPTMLEFYHELDDSDSFTISSGMESLPNSFLKALKNTQISFNSRVTNVTQDSTHRVSVEYFQDVRSISEKFNMTADYLIMTPSAPVVSFMEFHPQLSPKKRSSLRDSHHDHCTKIVLAFSKCFWEDEGIRGGHSLTDLPSRQYHYFTGDPGVVLSYTWGLDSQLFTGLLEKECLCIALDNLAAIHGQYIRKLYIGGTVKHWLLDQYTLGAYSCPFPLRRAKILESFRENDGLIWFAGEYTDIPHGWIETALKSGLRAAINVNKYDSKNQNSYKTEL